MMKLSVATNFDDKLIEELKKYPVYEVYGKLQEDYIGGGRPSNTLKSVDKTRLEEHVKKVRDSNIKFNYLLNGACLANKEQDVEWQKNVREFLDYLKEIGVNALTVTNPFLLQIIKKYYDCFTVRISTFACIDSYEKARYWEEMGRNCSVFLPRCYLKSRLPAKYMDTRKRPSLPIKYRLQALPGISRQPCSVRCVPNPEW